VNSSVGGLLDKGLPAKAAMKRFMQDVVDVLPRKMKFQHGNKFSIKEFSGSVSGLDHLLTN
jgi:hypothetical protein